jgi:phosphate transport system substrate-binding protein
MPTRLTVATEDYPLSRRLYLYTPANSTNPNVRRFIEFAIGKLGQDIVADNGFVAQNVKTETYAVPAGSPSDYARFTAGAQRLSLNFRFRTGSSQLDNKALVDLDRVVSFISDLRYSGNEVMLFGFADSTGADAVNERLSRDRARAVADQFDQRGLKAGLVTGFGSHNSVASNDTAEGREKNRRVEIWVKQKG